MQFVKFSFSGHLAVDGAVHLINTGDHLINFSLYLHFV